MPPFIGVRIDGAVTKIAASPSIHPPPAASCAQTRTSGPPRRSSASSRQPMSSKTRLSSPSARYAAANTVSLINMPQWLQGVRSTTISGGPSALTPHATTMSSAATGTPSLLHMTLFLDDQPALHLQMQRRAEFGAIEAERAGCLRD